LAKLPAALQESFKAPVEAEKELKRASLEGQMKVQRGIRSALEATTRFLANASDEDRRKVTEVLSEYANQSGPDAGGQQMPPGMSNMAPPGGQSPDLQKPEPPQGKGSQPAKPGERGAAQPKADAKQPAVEQKDTRAEDLCKLLMDRVDRRIDELNRALQEVGKQ
jgi:hypothetical protein